MRRHLIGLGLGVVMLIFMFFGDAWGYLRLLRLPAAANAPLSALSAQGGSLASSGGVLAAMGAVAATGLIAGILIAWPRISPLATGVPALVALAWTGLYLASVKEAVDLIPLRGHAFGAGWEALLFNGILGLAGLAMVIPMCLPARWRVPSARNEAIEAEVSDAREYVAGLKANMPSRPRQEEPVGGAVSSSGQRATAGAGMTAGARVTGGQPFSGGRGRPPLAGRHARLTGGQPRLTGGQPVASGEQRRPTGGQQRLTPGYRWPAEAQQSTGSQARLAGRQALINGKPMVTGAELSEQPGRPGARRQAPDDA